MATVVRVRRKRAEELPDSLVISCKRQRIDPPDERTTSDGANEIKTVFKYAGTIEEKDESVDKLILGAVRKSKLEQEYKRHQVDIPAKSRHQHRLIAKAKRYKVASQRRDLDDNVGDSKFEDKDLQSSDMIDCDDCDKSVGATSAEDNKIPVYDLEEEDLSVISQVTSTAANSDTVLCNGMPMIREKLSSCDQQYVYDLYYVNTAGFDHRLLENIMEVQAYEEEFIYEGYRDDENEEFYEDEDDSNDEDNWRNDYPDEDPFIYENEGAEYHYGDDGTCGFDVDENELGNMMNSKCNFVVDDEWSSEEEADSASLPRTSYEEYKKRVLKDLEGEDEDDDDNDDGKIS